MLNKVFSMVSIWSDDYTTRAAVSSYLFDRWTDASVFPPVIISLRVWGWMNEWMKEKIALKHTSVYSISLIKTKTETRAKRAAFLLFFSCKRSWCQCGQTCHTCFWWSVKPEHPEETWAPGADMGRPCKLHSERYLFWPWNRTRTLMLRTTLYDVAQIVSVCLLNNSNYIAQFQPVYNVQIE